MLNRLRSLQRTNLFKYQQSFMFSNGLNKHVPTAVSQKNSQYRKFIPNVYGLELRKHIFPSFRKSIALNEEQIKFYQKVAPNYVVALVQKVIEEGTQQELPSKNNNYDKFYRVSTYCHIKYLENNMVELEGLYRVKIENLQELTLETSEISEVAHEPIVTDEQAIQDEQEEEPTTPQKSEISLQELLKKTSPKTSNKKSKKESYYSLKVRKLDQPPIHINPNLQMRFKYLIETYMKMHQAVHNNSLPVVFNIIDLSRILDHIANQCSQMSSSKKEIQSCLEIVDPDERTDLVQKLLQKTMYVTTYMTDIEREAKNNLRNKKFYEYYSEIMKIAKQVLDGKKTKELFVQKSIKAFLEKNPTKEIKEVFDQEIEKYEQMDENSMEAGIIKTYIEQLSKIPYDVKSEEVFDLDYAERILDEDHYGMKDAKDAILEIIAVGKLKQTLKGKIFCFVGGPGLGKTTFAKSIAKALNRKFYNISLGGVTDSSVLKGHRRTYIGAYSGKIIEALKNCETNNPVILLDEIDKMGSSYQGDPRSELLEILDPNQNNSFVDNFVDVPVDLSNVLFITSANYEQNISKPLLDRMEKIKLSSYTKNEKIQIFKRHLIRRAMERTGIKADQFTIEDRVIEILVEEYSLGEPGVRYLQKNALIILQKIAYKIVTEEEEVPIKITPENVASYLGNSYFRQRDHKAIKKGVAISLGGGEYGGRLTYIEAFKKSYNTRHEQARSVLFTGSLGKVFKEAMDISYTYARNFLQHDRKNTFLYENEVHIHAPDGAAKKDGSTDSLTIACALISLAEQKKVRSGVALTGELTLNGKILHTTGIKEKVIVAQREKIEEVVMPIDNMPDVQMLTDELKSGIKFHFVSSFKQVYPLIFSSEPISPQKPLEKPSTTSNMQQPSL